MRPWMQNGQDTWLWRRRFNAVDYERTYRQDFERV
jgi:hypothetical protein